MPRKKKKVSEGHAIPVEEEVKQDHQASTLQQKETFLSNFPATQTYSSQGMEGICDGDAHLPAGSSFAVANTCDYNNEGMTPNITEMTPAGGMTPSIGEMTPAGGMTPSTGEMTPAGGMTPSTGEMTPAGGMTPSTGEITPAGGMTHSTGEITPSTGEITPAGGMTPSTGEITPLGGVTPTGVMTPTEGMIPNTAGITPTGEMTPNSVGMTLNTEEMDSQCLKITSNSSKNFIPTKKKKMSGEKILKHIILNCEWGMCTLTFKKMESFISHIAEHLLTMAVGPLCNSGYQCPWRECDVDSNTIEEMHRHVYFHAFHTKIKSIGVVLMEGRNDNCMLDPSGRNLIPEIPEDFECMWKGCNVMFTSAHDFYVHSSGHVKNTDKQMSKNNAFSCEWDGCSSSFLNQVRLRDHVRSHTQEKVVGCPNCGSIFANNTKFFDHSIRQTALESHQFQCSLCSRRYPNERLLRDHVRHHINHLKCPECDMTVSHKSVLEAHIRYRHRKEKQHKCMECGRGFKYQQDFTRHLSIHSAEFALTCPFPNCSQKYRAASSLNKHIKLDHNGLVKHHYACHLCDFRFPSGETLSKHLVKIHNFECPVGHIRFRYRQDEDGFYRLQTVRYESLELNQEINIDEEEDEEVVDSPEASIYPSSPASLSTQSSQLASVEPPVQHD